MINIKEVDFSLRLYVSSNCFRCSQPDEWILDTDGGLITPEEATKAYECHLEDYGWGWCPEGHILCEECLDESCVEPDCRKPLDDGEGYEGFCGNCADKAEEE